MRSDVTGPVIIVGAGLAGLACAQQLHRAGVAVQVLEASDAVGGRVRTDLLDGFRCDRGFQLLNPAYPVLDHVVDPAELDLRAFGAGVVVAHGSQRSVLADPRRLPARLPATLAAPLGSVTEKVRFARWAARSLRPVRRILDDPDRTLAEDLDRARLAGRLRSGVVEPFLAGVLAEQDGSTSARFAALLVRCFVLGSPAVPSLGMARFPELIAASLPPGAIQLNTAVRSVTARTVRTADQELLARSVVVATDPYPAADLCGLSRPAMKALTTFWHTAAEPPSQQRLLHLDADRRGPVINTAVLTAVAPTYAPAGRSLIATTVLGADGSGDVELAARRQAAAIYGSDPESWELVTSHVISAALPAQPPPLQVRRPVALDNGLFVAGDHRDTAAIQGALVSGRRAATAVLTRLGVLPTRP
ncbi:MAG TPA: NAD(P)/FAD-dependent oxidoreductase [Propionibacteriaceae bacterium]|nr:NAD(P)/FAD-dependent oxidoreductase [Propionibacteriaceae bacterium]